MLPRVFVLSALAGGVEAGCGGNWGDCKLIAAFGENYCRKTWNYTDGGNTTSCAVPVVQSVLSPEPTATCVGGEGDCVADSGFTSASVECAGNQCDVSWESDIPYGYIIRARVCPEDFDTSVFINSQYNGPNTTGCSEILGGSNMGGDGTDTWTSSMAGSYVLVVYASLDKVDVQRNAAFTVAGAPVCFGENGDFNAAYDACGYDPTDITKIADDTKFCSAACGDAVAKAATTCDSDPTYGEGFKTFEAGHMEARDQKCDNLGGGCDDCIKKFFCLGGCDAANPQDLVPDGCDTCGGEAQTFCSGDKTGVTCDSGNGTTTAAPGGTDTSSAFAATAPLLAAFAISLLQ